MALMGPPRKSPPLTWADDESLPRFQPQVPRGAQTCQSLAGASCRSPPQLLLRVPKESGAVHPRPTEVMWLQDLRACVRVGPHTPGPQLPAHVARKTLNLSPIFLLSATMPTHPQHTHFSLLKITKSCWIASRQS